MTKIDISEHSKVAELDDSIVCRYTQSYLGNIQRLMSSLYGHATSLESDEEFKQKCNELLKYMLLKFTEISFSNNGDSAMKR